MTREDIIAMARESGLIPEKSNIAYQHPHFEQQLERFAALASKAERKACAEHYTDIMRKAVMAEREACAEILIRNANRCDQDGVLYKTLMSNADAIRARSNDSQ